MIGSGARVYEADSGKELWKMDGSYYTVAFSPDGRDLTLVDLSSGVHVLAGADDLPSLQARRRRAMSQSREKWHQSVANAEAAANRLFGLDDTSVGRFVAELIRTPQVQSAIEATLAYIVRAVTPGTFVHPAATVEDMYRPEHYARTAAGTLTVKE